MSSSEKGSLYNLSNRSFRLRGTRITEAQAKATEKFWDEFGIEPDHRIIPSEIFPTSKQVIMEIGTGMGEATAEIARTFPDIGFFALEVHRPGIGSLLARINEFQLTNLRLINEDARIVLEELMPDECLDAVHLYFPDPWHKKKHWKRRIVQRDFVDLIYRKLKLGGHIHIATDWVPYAEWSQNKFAEDSRFIGGVIPKPDFRPLTRFEGKGIGKGHLVTDLKYVKA
ncbi:MAG: tRNA (guanosine(46)-N7)-methyltransferase TrmB [Actinobacteria bacterium]|uniref:tRNA (guanine(46)-N(7))-methyltransferase n=1 Tax=freshwater metagenome TaxID=449393 RepID=A0A6J6H9U4_9ZZZZ|nr:tRNA (guanosine(46)-N7)-methyltransferase TrmB [Actinomycetota bacterium]